MSALPTSSAAPATPPRPRRRRKPDAPGRVIPFPGQQPHALVDDPTTPVTVGWSLATEDYDPTPIPAGCYDCTSTGGMRCRSCPGKAPA